LNNNSPEDVTLDPAADKQQRFTKDGENFFYKLSAKVNALSWWTFPFVYAAMAVVSFGNMFMSWILSVPLLIFTSAIVTVLSFRDKKLRDKRLGPINKFYWLILVPFIFLSFIVVEEVQMSDPSYAKAEYEKDEIDKIKKEKRIQFKVANPDNECNIIKNSESEVSEKNSSLGSRLGKRIGQTMAFDNCIDRLIIEKEKTTTEFPQSK
jgi:hypothetical protein